MSLAAIYNIFNGEELLQKSIGPVRDNAALTVFSNMDLRRLIFFA